MNRQGHLISSLLILSIIETVFISILLRDFGAVDVFITGSLSLVFYLLGCLAPDFDHEKVQKLTVILWIIPIRKWCHHRGHFHSFLLGLGIYCVSIVGICFLFSFIYPIVYWWIVVISGGVGFFAHLMEDDANRYKLEKKPERALKPI